MYFMHMARCLVREKVQCTNKYANPDSQGLGWTMAKQDYFSQLLFGQFLVVNKVRSAECIDDVCQCAMCQSKH